MDNPTPLEQAKTRLGLKEIARVCQVSREAARKWLLQGHLPRTEWTGETDYAGQIAQADAARLAATPRLDERPLTREQLLSCRPTVRMAEIRRQAEIVRQLTDGSQAAAAA